ncbi:MAG: hypothetical protein ACFFD1_14770 [Candidatus Thorarchaeota archaeon]
MAEKQEKILAKEDIDLLVNYLKALHPHLCMMNQYEQDLINNTIRRFRLHGNDIHMQENEFFTIEKIAKKLRIKIEG